MVEASRIEVEGEEEMIGVEGRRRLLIEMINTAGMIEDLEVTEAKIDHKLLGEVIETGNMTIKKGMVEVEAEEEVIEMMTVA